MDGVGVAKLVTYDPRGYLATVNYTGDNGATSGFSNDYDYDGRLFRADDVSFKYNADGTVSEKGSNGTAISYSYYPDSMLAGVGAMATSNSQATPGDIVNQPNLYQYGYRNDGLLATEAFAGWDGSMALAYTRGGRPTTMTDFPPSPSISSQYADGYGRLSSYQTPSGTYGAIVYDAQGRMTQYTDPYARIDGETVVSTFNIRGDLVGRTFSPGSAAAKPGFAYKNIQGVLVQNAGDQYDGRTGAPVWIYAAGAFQYDSVGRLVNAGGALGYDAESRLVSGDTWNASMAADNDCHSGGAVAPGLPPPSSSRELTYRYDGIGQLLQDKTQDGATRQWTWNGSNVVFTAPMTPNYYGIPVMGAPSVYGADGLGSMTPNGSSPGLTIADHDFDGGVVQYHNSTGHSAWAATNTYNQFCQHASPLPASSNYNVPPKSAFPGNGTSDPGLSVSSTGRAYLSLSMGFTTPDYSSGTPYASGQRGVRDYCDHGNLVHTKDGPHNIIHCGVANPYVPPPCDASQSACGHLQGPDNPFGTRTPPRNFRFGNLPANATICWAQSSAFFAPPNFNMNTVVNAGKADGWNPIAWNAAVGHYGRFDYQRSRDSAGNTTFYKDYTPVSNFNVGAYLYGVGASKSTASAISNAFAAVGSSNAGAKEQSEFRNLGFDTAASGKAPICN